MNPTDCTGAEDGVVDPQLQVLLIEDDLVDEIATLRTISRDGLPYKLKVARTIARARALLQAETFDVILADYQLDEGTSFDLMDAFGDQLVIFITGAWDPTAASRALRLGVHDYLIKDHDGQYLKLLHYRIETALRQRRLARQLRESEALLQAILDNAPVSISAHDLSGRLILSNRHYAQHAAAPESACLPLPPPQVPRESEETHTEADGNQHTYLTVRFALPSAQGQGQAVGSIAVDITERRRASEALLEAKAAAEAANAAKSAFLSNISHEIRTPLNAVIGITHLLAESVLTEDQHMLLRKAQLAGRSLLGIVNDVLDLSKIEAGEIALDEAPYRPAALLAEIEAVYAPQASQKGLSFTVCVGPSVPEWLQSDSSRLRQVLVNLVANAIKFTQRGGIEVELSCTGRSQDRCSLLIRVRDSGIGIEAGVRKKLFSPFIQADMSTTRRYGGTGLGLSIVKRLAQIMGGEVGVNSTPDAGSEFWVAVPQTLPTEQQTALGSRSHSLLEVVVVDDDPVERLELTSQVRALGWHAVPLDSGAALMRALSDRRASGLALPDVMLVDWQMPAMNGLQVLASLAERSSPQHIPAVLVVTAYERDSLPGMDTATLADHVLTKPVCSSALFNAVNDSLARHQGSTDRLLQSTRVDATDTLWLAAVQVLLVDDSEINLEVARRLLEGRGARVQTCTGGNTALSCLRERPTDFDVVLMDVQMPDMDGLEATRRIRSELGMKDLPVIALTAGALMEERRRALDAGMQGFLSKPLDPVDLIRVVRQCVEAARGCILPVTGLETKAAGLTHWPAIEGINAADVKGRLDNDVPLFLSLLRHLLAEFGDIDGVMGSASESAEQRQALTARLHKLRGCAGTVGAHEVQHLCAAAEASLKAGEASAAAAVRAVALGLAQLAENSAAALAASPRAGDVPRVDDGRLALTTTVTAGELIERLQRQLKCRDLAALETFNSVRSALAGVLGAPAVEAMCASLEALEFTPAVNLLAAGLAPSKPIEALP